jgi:hypothetical protein
MAAEAAPEILASLPPWAQLTYTVGALFGAGGLGLLAWLKSWRDEKKAAAKPALTSEPDHFDPDELLAAAPITKLLSDITDLAATSRIIAEGVKNISAAATIWAKTREDGYDEVRVWKAVDARWEELMERDRDREDKRDRDERPAPRDGRGNRRRGQGSGGWGG